MIKQISFENYRIFKNRQVLDIKPIVIIFGKNNSGKTALIRLPLLIKSSLFNKGAGVIDASYMDLHLFDDPRSVVYGRANKAVSFSVIEDGNACLKYSFYIDDTKEEKTVMESWSLDTDSGMYAVHIDKDEEFHLDNTNDPISSLKFCGVTPNEPRMAALFNDYKDKFDYQVDYIGPFRRIPKGFFTFEPVSEFSGIDGAKNYNFLITDSNSQEKILQQKVSRWYEENFDGWKLFLNRDREPVYSIELINDSLKINVKDAGVGIGQSLPVVIRACRPCKEKTLIILEEPEAHLHPAAHANMGQLLADSISEDNNKHYLIETHSINLILRIRRMIAEGNLSPEDVALYYVDFDKEENGSTLKPIQIRKDGSVDFWPQGVFDETLQETIAIRKAQN